jgi:hypothetical protein
MLQQAALQRSDEHMLRTCKLTATATATATAATTRTTDTKYYRYRYHCDLYAVTKR